MTEEKEQFEEIIRQLIPIGDLSPSAQIEVIEAAKILQFKKKKFVFKERDEDHYSFYILAGELELIANHHVHNTMVGGAENARYALAQLQPRQFSAKAKTPVTILRLDRSALDRLMVHEGNKETETGATSEEMGVSRIEEEDSGDWMTRMLQSDLFARLPMSNIQQLFAFLEPVVFETGDTVIKQGEPGDNYYIIQEGTCEVTRVPGEGKEPVKLAELTVGDSFGEEALLTDATRNATVTMLSDGVLMQLNKDSFVDLIKKPSLSSLSFNQATEVINEGGEWIDVRFAEEFKASHIGTSANIPLNLLRAQIDEFSHDKHYVLYCDTGGRSSAAAFLLTKDGFHVSYLEGGLVSNPEATNEQVQGEEIESPTKQEIEKNKAVQEIMEEETVDAVVKASALETDLAKNKMEREAADKKHKYENEQADKQQREALEEEKKKLEQEKDEIERQKKLAEEEVEQKRQQEEQKIEKSKKDAAFRMEEEKEKLKEVYTRNTEEMKKLQEMKARAEAQIKKAREQLEKQASESRRELDEARNLKDSVKEAKKKIEEEAEQQKIKHAELEKNVKAKAKALLNDERRKLAEKIAQNNEELEQAQKEKAVAEAGRVAAKKEAEKIIEEYKDYKAQFEKEKAELQAQLKAERSKLEKESQQIRGKLDEVHKAKDKAEAARKAAEKDAENLKTKQAKQAAKGGAEDIGMEEEMRLAEETLEEAKRTLDDAKHDEKITEAAKEINEEDLLRQKEEEEKLRKKMEAELKEWKEDEDERLKQFEGEESQVAHIKRIQEKAIEAKKMQEESTQSLFADVSQLIKDHSHKNTR